MMSFMMLIRNNVVLTIHDICHFNGLKNYVTSGNFYKNSLDSNDVIERKVTQQPMNFCKSDVIFEAITVIDTMNALVG